MTQTILIADDHRLLREGLRALLERDGFQVVAEADNGRSAVRLAKQLQPDIVITDIAMPDLNGIEATRQMLAEAPRSKVLALSMHTESGFVLGILEAGASGYLLKDAAFEELSVAIKAVLKDQIYLSPAIAGVVVGQSLGRLGSKAR